MAAEQRIFPADAYLGFKGSVAEKLANGEGATVNAYLRAVSAPWSAVRRHYRQGRPPAVDRRCHAPRQVVRHRGTGRPQEGLPRQGDPRTAALAGIPGPGGGRHTIAAKEEILLNVGGGAYIRMAGGNIEVHCPGTVSVKGTEHVMSGPARFNFDFPKILGTKDVHDEKFKINSIEGLSLYRGYKYRMTLSDNQVKEGSLDKAGATSRHYTKQSEEINSIDILPSTIIKLDGGDY